MQSEHLILPTDLSSCESDLYNTLVACYENNPYSRLSINLKFEGLKIIPLIFRLLNKLDKIKLNTNIAFSDEGSSALAKRDYPNYRHRILTYKDINNFNNIDKEQLVIAISPQPYDYEEFESMAINLSNNILMINGKLEDSAIGVGLVARERRVKFIKSWKHIFWLEPLSKGAIFRSYPSDWNVYKYTPEGYTFCNSYKSYPNMEILESDLS